MHWVTKINICFPWFYVKKRVQSFYFCKIKNVLKILLCRNLRRIVKKYYDKNLLKIHNYFDFIKRMEHDSRNRWMIVKRAFRFQINLIILIKYGKHREKCDIFCMIRIVESDSLKVIQVQTFWLIWSDLNQSN